VWRSESDRDLPRKPIPGTNCVRGFSKDGEPSEYEDEDEALRKKDWRVRAFRHDSITRSHITIYYVIGLVWVADTRARLAAC
jgi:hypothetical protein